MKEGEREGDKTDTYIREHGRETDAICRQMDSSLSYGRLVTFMV